MTVRHLLAYIFIISAGSISTQRCANAAIAAETIDDGLPLPSVNAQCTPLAETETVHPIDSSAVSPSASRIATKAMNIGNKAIDLITNRPIKYDTLYIQRPQNDWTFRLRFSNNGAAVGIKTNIQGGVLTADLQPHKNYSIGAGISYKGIGISAGINPKIFHKTDGNHDFNFRISSYTNRYGFEFQYQSTNTFTGTSSYNEDEYQMGEGETDLDMLIANAYYVLNHRHFSMPAALTQSYIQRRSAGSLLLGASMVLGKFHTNYPDDDDQFFHFKTKIGLYGLGVGYGYNFVIKRNFLVHLSLVPNLTVINSTDMTIDGYRHDIDKSFPDFILVGRYAFVYNKNRYIFSLSGFFNHAYYDKHAENYYYYYYEKWTARLSVGYRL